MCTASGLPCIRWNRGHRIPSGKLADALTELRVYMERSYASERAVGVMLKGVRGYVEGQMGPLEAHVALGQQSDLDREEKSRDDCRSDHRLCYPLR